MGPKPRISLEGRGKVLGRRKAIHNGYFEEGYSQRVIAVRVARL